MGGTARLSRDLACSHLTARARVLDAGCRDAAHLNVDSNLHWEVFQLLAKLLPVVYLLRRVD